MFIDLQNKLCFRLDGVLIAYSNIKLRGDIGQIIDDGPYIHFKILADFVIFQPRVGLRLKAVVNKLSKDHVGLLVHNHFNVSVPLNRNGFGNKEHVLVSKGDECEFTVTHVFMHRNLLSLRGKNIQRC